MGKESEQAVDSKRRLRLDLYGWVAVVVLVLAGMIEKPSDRSMSDAEMMGYRVGGAVGTLIAGLLIGGLLGLFVRGLRRGSNRAFNVTLLVVALMLGVGQLPKLEDRENESVMDDLEAVGRDLAAREKELIRRELNGENVDAEREAMAAERMSHLQQAAEGSAGEQAKFVQVSITVTEQLQELAIPFSLALDELEASGWVDAAEISTPQQIEENRRLIQDVVDSNLAILDFLREIDDRILEAGREEGLSPRRLRRFTAGFRESGKVEQMVRIRATTDKYGQEFLDLLTFLEGRIGTWTVDAEGYVIFESSQDDQAYDAILDRINVLIEQEEALLRELASP